MLIDQLGTFYIVTCLILARDIPLGADSLYRRQPQKEAAKNGKGEAGMQGKPMNGNNEQVTAVGHWDSTLLGASKKLQNVLHNFLTGGQRGHNVPLLTSLPFQH